MTREGALELVPIDLSPDAHGNTGVPYATTFDSGEPGPHLMISALVHGNEVCGAHALVYLLESDVRPQRGKLTLAFMNVAAYHAFDTGTPNASRCLDEDFNRLWSIEVLEGNGESRELARARTGARSRPRRAAAYRRRCRTRPRGTDA